MVQGHSSKFALWNKVFWETCLNHKIFQKHLLSSFHKTLVAFQVHCQITLFWMNHNDLMNPRKFFFFGACWWYPPAQRSFAWIPRSLAPHETLCDTLCSKCESSVSGGLFMCDLMYPWCIVDVLSRIRSIVDVVRHECYECTSPVSGGVLMCYLMPVDVSLIQRWTIVDRLSIIRSIVDLNK